MEVEHRSRLVIGVSAFHTTDISNTSTICIFQILTVSSSVPLKVSAALSAAKEAGYSLEDLLQREQIISNLLNQVKTLNMKRLK